MAIFGILYQVVHLELAWLWRKAALVLTDSRSKDGRKLETCWETHRQLLEESSRIRDPVQFTSRKQNPKDNEQP